MFPTDLYPKFNQSSQERIMSQSPTLCGVVAGVRFYEHPKHGDEVGLMALADGQLYQTDFYDVPSLDELMD